MINGHRSYFSSDQDYINYIDNGNSERKRCVYCGALDCEENPVTEVEIEYNGYLTNELQCEICKNTKP